MCWWEDEGTEPWEYSGPNAQTLIEAQREFLADDRPFRRRAGKVRAPKRSEARDPDWSPLEVTDELLARARQATEDERRRWEEEDRAYAAEVEADPEGPFVEYNTEVHLLAAKASSTPYRQLRQELTDLNRRTGLALPAAYVELQARQWQDPDFYRHHPVRAAWWMVRSRRLGSVPRRWRILRTGEITFAG